MQIIAEVIKTAVLISTFVFASYLGLANAASINVAVLGLANETPLYIGLEKGYLAQAGIQVKTHMFVSGATAMAPLAVNQIQLMANGGVSPGLFNGVARGMPIKIVATSARILPGHDSDVLLVRTDLKDVIKRVSDFKGRKFGINHPASPLLYQVGKVLESKGLSLKDVQMVTIPFPQMIVAFKNKAIEVALAADPFGFINIKQGTAVQFPKQVSDFITDPYHDIGVVIYNGEWASKEPQLAKNFMVAWVKGAREFIAALKGGPNRGEVTDILLKHGRIKSREILEKMVVAYTDPNGFVDIRSIEDQANWYHAQGFVPTKPDINKVVDLSYSEYAVKKLGRYKE